MVSLGQWMFVERVKRKQEFAGGRSSCSAGIVTVTQREKVREWWQQRKCMQKMWLSRLERGGSGFERGRNGPARKEARGLGRNVMNGSLRGLSFAYTSGLASTDLNPLPRRSSLAERRFSSRLPLHYLLVSPPKLFGLWRLHERIERKHAYHTPPRATSSAPRDTYITCLSRETPRLPLCSCGWQAIIANLLSCPAQTPPLKMKGSEPAIQRDFVSVELRTAASLPASLISAAESSEGSITVIRHGLCYIR